MGCSCTSKSRKDSIEGDEANSENPNNIGQGSSSQENGNNESRPLANENSSRQKRSSKKNKWCCWSPNNDGNSDNEAYPPPNEPGNLSPKNEAVDNTSRALTQEIPSSSRNNVSVNSHSPTLSDEQSNTSTLIAVQETEAKVERSPKGSSFYSKITDELEALLKRREDCVEIFYKKKEKAVNIKPLFFQKDWGWDDTNFIQLPIDNKYGRWQKIDAELSDLKEMCENGELKKQPNFVGRVLTAVISSYAEDESSDFAILNETDISAELVAKIPFIVEHALKLPHLLAHPIPKLKKGENKTIFMTKQLCCCLLANAFFCTFPEPLEEDMPNFNFFQLYNSTIPEKTIVKKEKLRCILNYFEQMSPEVLQENSSSQIGDNIVSFERRWKDFPKYVSSSKRHLIEVKVESNKKIEEMDGALQVDFANKLIGGGVLGNGAVQEEVRFSICPELIVSRLFTEVLDNDEVVFITGTQQFSEYSGYGSSFKFVKPMFKNNIKNDELGRMRTQVVAMDAIRFKQHEKSSQFLKSSIDRELHKSYVAFSHNGKDNSPVATGNWGCGAFNGDIELKFLIQLIAATENERVSMYYHTVGDEDQSEGIQNMMEILNSNQVTVGKLYEAVIKYNEKKDEYDSVFDFVRDSVTS